MVTASVKTEDVMKTQQMIARRTDDGGLERNIWCPPQVDVGNGGTGRAVNRGDRATAGAGRTAWWTLPKMLTALS